MFLIFQIHYKITYWLKWMPKLNILILDDDEIIRKGVIKFLNWKDYQTFEAEKPNQAFSILSKKEIDIVLLDIKLLLSL